MMYLVKSVQCSVEYFIYHVVEANNFLFLHPLLDIFLQLDGVLGLVFPQDVAADQQREFLCDDVPEINQGNPVGWVSAENKNFGSEVFNVFRGIS